MLNKSDPLLLNQVATEFSSRGWVDLVPPLIHTTIIYNFNNKVFKCLRIHNYKQYFEIEVKRNTRLNLYSSLALNILLYDSECCTGRAKDKSRLTSPEMKLKKTTGYICQTFTDMKKLYNN